VRDCQDLQPIRELDVDHVIREATHEDAPHILILDTWHGRSCSGAFRNPREGAINLHEKLRTEPCPVAFVPAHGLRHLDVGFLADSKF
jgi:hypothetical protein